MLTDFDFFPFNYNYLAISYADGTIKLWNVPENL